jgi:glycerol-3-phosphate O-acyltransferase
VSSAKAIGLGRRPDSELWRIGLADKQQVRGTKEFNQLAVKGRDAIVWFTNSSAVASSRPVCSAIDVIDYSTRD